VYIRLQKSRAPRHCDDCLLRWLLLSLDPEHATTFLALRILRWLLNFRGGGSKLYIYIYIYIHVHIEYIVAHWLWATNRRPVTLLYLATRFVEESVLTEQASHIQRQSG